MKNMKFFQRPTSSFINQKSKIEQIENTLKIAGYIQPSQRYHDFLVNNKIIDANETVENMFTRVARTIATAGMQYYAPTEQRDFESKTHQFLSEFKIVLSTPFYTNAGRHHSKSLSACAVPPINFRTIRQKELEKMVNDFHIQGMGTGFNFDSVEKPTEMLLRLNSIAEQEVDRGLIERPVGNMGILSVDHPEILPFARAKVDNVVKNWKFNISINFTEQFMRSLLAGNRYTSPWGHQVNPKYILDNVSECARVTGDPGALFLHRSEQSNKTPHLGNYVSVSPCSEVPLLSGEVCHFGYLNLFNFIQNQAIDYTELREAIYHLVEALDNTIELSLMRLPGEKSSAIIAKIRRIGIGLCGFSDLLSALGIPYHAPKALEISENIISFINYHSKCASVALAESRGAFPAYYDQETKRSLILSAFVDKPTQTVSLGDWQQLEKDAQTHGIRHISTVILPPTGRSALMAGVSTSIEPHFKLFVDEKFEALLKLQCERCGYNQDITADLDIIRRTGSILSTNLPEEVKRVFYTTLELTASAHLGITAAFQKYTDEAISKTVNLVSGSSTEDVYQLYIDAYQQGLKGISIYVDKSRLFQPKPLATETQGLAAESSNLPAHR